MFAQPVVTNTPTKFIGSTNLNSKDAALTGHRSSQTINRDYTQDVECIFYIQRTVVKTKNNINSVKHVTSSRSDKLDKELQ